MPRRSRAGSRFLPHGLAADALGVCDDRSSKPKLPRSVGKIDVSSLTAAMAERDRALESMQTSAVMEYHATAPIT